MWGPFHLISSPPPPIDEIDPFRKSHLWRGVGGEVDVKWNGPKWKASHPHTREWGALAGDLSDFKLPVLPRFAGFPTVLEVSIIERGPLARLRQEFAFDAIFNRDGTGTEAYKPCFWWLNWNIHVGHFTVNKAGVDLVLMQRTLPAFLCKSCCSYTIYYF